MKKGLKEIKLTSQFFVRIAQQMFQILLVFSSTTYQFHEQPRQFDYSPAQWKSFVFLQLVPPWNSSFLVK